MDAHYWADEHVDHCENCRKVVNEGEYHLDVEGVVLCLDCAAKERAVEPPWFQEVYDAIAEAVTDPLDRQLAMQAIEPILWRAAELNTEEPVREVLLRLPSEVADRLYLGALVDGDADVIRGALEKSETP